MTCEIAIFNKIGIAVATDSAVTLTSDKIFNSANKLFALSKHEPVGIMIYGAANINRIPWEILIKEYRNILGNTSFDDLDGYYTDFLKFIINFDELKKFSVVENVLLKFLDYFIDLYQKRKKDIKQLDNEIFCEIYTNLKDKLLQEQDDSMFASVKINEVELIKSIFIKCGIEIIETQINQINELFSLHIKKVNKIPMNVSGIAIMGYGKNNLYPKLANFETIGMIYDNIKITLEKKSQIDNNMESLIAPFAQREMTDLFMSGILASHRQSIINKITNYTKILLDVINHNIANKSVCDAIKTESSKELSKIIHQFDSETEKYSGTIVGLVSILNKEELINLAKSLIELQELKKTVSMDSPSVGGPVDIAFISKHDGFIWIKRKLYFDKDLNHCFFNNYYNNKQ